MKSYRYLNQRRGARVLLVSLSMALFALTSQPAHADWVSGEGSATDVAADEAAAVSNATAVDAGVAVDAAAAGETGACADYLGKMDNQPSPTSPTKRNVDFTWGFACQNVVSGSGTFCIQIYRSSIGSWGNLTCRGSGTIYGTGSKAGTVSASCKAGNWQYRPWGSVSFNTSDGYSWTVSHHGTAVKYVCVNPDAPLSVDNS